MGRTPIVDGVGLVPFPGENVCRRRPGSVLFTQNRTGNTVSAGVVVERSVPNATYVIRLIQNDAATVRRLTPL